MVHREHVLNVPNHVPPSHLEGLIAGHHNGGAGNSGRAPAGAIGVDGGGREVAVESLRGRKREEGWKEAFLKNEQAEGRRRMKLEVWR